MGEGSVAGEGSVGGDGSVAGDEEGSIKDLNDKTGKLGLDENTPPSDETLSTPVNEVKAPAVPESFEAAVSEKDLESPPTPKSAASSSDPNKAQDLAALKQGQPHSSLSNAPSRDIDDMAANAMAQNLGEYVIAPEEKKIQGGEAGQFMEDVEIPDEILVPPAQTKQEYGGEEELQIQEVGKEGDKDVIKADEEKAAEQPNVVVVGKDVPATQSAKSEEPVPIKTDSEKAAEEPDVVTVGEDVPPLNLQRNPNLSRRTPRGLQRSQM